MPFIFIFHSLCSASSASNLIMLQAGTVFTTRFESEEIILVRRYKQGHIIDDLSLEINSLKLCVPHRVCYFGMKGCQ